MIPKLANMKPVAKPNVPPRRRLTPAYTAREPMTKSTMPQMNRIGMNSSISRRLCAQVLLANSEIASRMWKPPSTNIIIAAYVSQPGRPIVGVLSPPCSTIILLSLVPILGTSTRVELACSSHHIGIQAEQVVTLHSAQPLSEVHPQLR